MQSAVRLDDSLLLARNIRMEKMNSTDLCIPIYLNQQIVFDLLAVFDDGFSRLSTIKTSTGETETNKSGIGASIGISNVFALLGISFSGEREKKRRSKDKRKLIKKKCIRCSN